MATVAVIGAGLSGLVASRELARSHDVAVFEKSRGVGGRMATRRAAPYEFDHGAQFFTARTKAFRTYLEPLIESGIVADWPAVFAELRGGEVSSNRHWGEEYPHFVGVPGMNAVGKALASDLDVRLETTVGSLSRQDACWLLRDDSEQDLGEFDWVVVTTPASQAADLLAGTALASCTNVEMLSCFALLLGFDAAPDRPWQAAVVRDADISWISVNSSKPGRPAATSIVAHSTNAWANAHIDDDPGVVQRHLSEAFSAVSGIDAAGAAYAAVHRWRYANVEQQAGERFALDAGQKLAACGDWFVRGRVEAAFTSANALVEKLAPML